MEWAEKTSLLEEQDLRLFNFEQIQSEVLTSRIIEGTPAIWRSKKLISDEDWTRWLDEMETQQRQPNEDVLTLLIGGRKTLQIPCSELKILPYSKSIFRRIISAFHIHRSIARSITRNTSASFTFVRVNDSSYNCEKLVYNCRSSSEWTYDLGLSVTYCVGDRSTHAVLYGCCEKARQKFVSRLEHSHYAAHHPLLLPTIFAEYERERHFELVRPLTQTLVCRVMMLDIADHQPAEPGDTSDAEDESEAYVQQWLRISWLKNGLENWRQELDKMIAHSNALCELKLHARRPSKDTVDSTESTPVNASFSDDAFQVGSHGHHDTHDSKAMEDAGRRIHQRLLELRGEYDEKIRACSTVIEGMALAAQLEWNKVGREDALTNRQISQSSVDISEATRRDGERVRIIAILTMVFLPATFVATVFSMTFFNWTPGENEVVLSPYIWIYAVGTAIFTCLTLGSWYYYGKHRQRHWKKDASTGHSFQEQRDDSNGDADEKDLECEACVEQVENHETGIDKNE